MTLLRRRLNFYAQRWMTSVDDHGSVIAASLPMALQQAIMRGQLQRGQRALMLGTSAGFSVGGLVLES